MLKVRPIPAFNDNYIWAIHLPEDNEVLIVDPGDANPVIEYIKSHSLKLKAVLITHSHMDHIGGIDTLTRFQKAPVYGPKCNAIPQVTDSIGEGDTLSIGSLKFDIWHLPGHLPEHVAYIYRGKNETRIFSGDIMFSSGCGRIFDGTHQELKASLERFNTLPGNTLIHGAHEYTLSNLDFAQAVEPDNHDIKAKIRVAKTLREQGTPTLPTVLEIEQKTNPFLRSHVEEVIKQVKKERGVELEHGDEVFKALREWKNVF